MDLKAGFHQIPIAKHDQDKSAFIYPGGFFKWLFMPFGLRNAPSCFQKLMDKVLRPIPKSEAEVYIDDLLLKSRSFQQHLKVAIKVLEQLKQYNLLVKLEKCHFLRHSVAYLGYEISEEGLLPGKKKIKAIEEFPTPTNIKEVRRFLGLGSYFRRFIAHFSTIASPLRKLLLKGAKWEWTEKQEWSFQTLKNKLISADVLAYPDSTKPFYLWTDASKMGLGACLMQKDEKLDKKPFRPIGYASRSLIDHETHYTTTEMELLAVVFALQYWKYIIHGCDVTVVTDHQALKHLLE